MRRALSTPAIRLRRRTEIAGGEGSIAREREGSASAVRETGRSPDRRSTASSRARLRARRGERRGQGSCEYCCPTVALRGFLRGVGEGTHTGSAASQSETWPHATSIGLAGENTRGLVTTRRKARRLPQGMPRRRHRSVVGQANGGHDRVARIGSCVRRREYWRRRGSLIRVALGDCQNLRDVVDRHQLRRTVENARPKALSRLWP